MDVQCGDVAQLARDVTRHLLRGLSAAVKEVLDGGVNTDHRLTADLHRPPDAAVWRDHAPARFHDLLPAQNEAGPLGATQSFAPADEDDIRPHVSGELPEMLF